MLSPDQKRHTREGHERVVPIVLNPLNTDLFRVSAYRGAELQKANRQLAQFTRTVSCYWRNVIDMPTTHIVFALPTLLAERAAPLMTLSSLISLAVGYPTTALLLLAGGMGLRMINRDPVPLEEYYSVLDKIEATRADFLQDFKNPLRASVETLDTLAGQHALRYFTLGVSALTPESCCESAMQRDFILKLRQAVLLLDLEVDPFDYHAPGVIKSRHFSDDVRTLELLSRMFDTAGDFSLNCFEHDRARFEEDFKKLRAHLDTIKLNSSALAASAEPQSPPTEP